MKSYLIPILIVSIGLSSCTADQRTKYANKEFKTEIPAETNLMRESTQVFTINSDSTTVIEGADGTVVAVGEGSLLNIDGTPYNGEVNLRLYEALDAESMMKANLGSQSGEDMLESDGTVFVDFADKDGNPLKVDINKPIHIEVPTADMKSGMEVYNGKVNDKGDINWTKAEDVENYLTTVDIATLDFLPKIFRDSIGTVVKFEANDDIDAKTDSFYYTVAAYEKGTMPKASALKKYRVVDLNEAYTNIGARVEDYEYVEGSYNTLQSGTEEATDTLSAYKRCGVSPAIIKTIQKNEKFNNTMVATREFEARLQELFKSCINADHLAEAYINAGDKNMWEIDEFVARELEKNNCEATPNLYTDFDEFAGQKKGKVRLTETSKAISRYYKKRLQEIEKELAEAEEAFMKPREKEKKYLDGEMEDYKELLFKREIYRYKRYNWTFTQTGWQMIARVPVPVCDWQSVGTTLKNEYDRAYTYVVMMDMKSLYRLNSKDYKNFYAGNHLQKKFPFPCRQNCKLVSVCYKDDKIFMGETDFNLPGTNDNLNMNVVEVSEKELQQRLNNYKFLKENRIDIDLEYQKKITQLNQINKEINDHHYIMIKLANFAHPSCKLELYGWQ